MDTQPFSTWDRVAVIGGGAMGCALAALAARAASVRLWVYEPELVDLINTRHENPLFLPDVRLPDNVRATHAFDEALDGAQVIFSVTPAQAVRAVWEQIADLAGDVPIVCASKGIEVGTGKLLAEVFSDVLGSGVSDRLAVLSGPSFAQEIVAGHPTAVVVASRNHALAVAVQHLLSGSTFRVYTSDDVVGVELGGALKNVIALAVGAAEGYGLGINSRSALITRGLAEINRLAVACGADPLTLSGLAGVGDLVLTCTGHLSRNLRAGIRLGKGESAASIVRDMNNVIEGIPTAKSALRLARSKGIELPITEVVVGMIDGELGPKEAVERLMGRRLRPETEQ